MKTCRYLWVVIACITCADCTVGYVLHYYGREVNPIAGWMIASVGIIGAVAIRAGTVAFGYATFLLVEKTSRFTAPILAGVITGAAFAASLLVYGAILLS